jgi:hypothetical protein
MTQTIINLGTGGAALNGQNGSTAGADSNDALFLDWPGDNQGNYVYLPSVGGNYLSVPDEAALDIIGDIDIRVQVAMDDWTPTGAQTLLSKYSTSSGFSYLLRLETSGALLFIWSENGTTNKSATSTAATATTDGAVRWVRVTLDVNNGSSGNDVTFFVSNDGSTWNQLGNVVTTAGTTSIFSSSTALFIGQWGVSSDVAAGKFYRAQVLNGIGGTTALDVDTSRITSGSNTSFTAVTGQAVTINRSTSGRRSVAVVTPVWLFGTDDFMTVPNNALLDINADDDFTVIGVARVWVAGVVNPLVSKGTGMNNFVGYLWRTNNVTPNNMQAVIGEGSGFGTAYTSPAFTVGDPLIATLVADRAGSSLSRYANNSVTTGAGSFGNITTGSLFTVGRQSAPSTVYANAEIVAVAFFRRTLSASEVASIVAYYQSRMI